MSTQIKIENGRSVFVDLDGFDRIREHSSERVNKRLDREIQQNVREWGAQSEAVISQRIDELDREWDINRAVMAMAAGVGLGLITLGRTQNKKFFRLLPVPLAFLLAQAGIGWCPPAAALRRLGFRSTKEIDAEKYALKSLRGDFKTHPEHTENV